MYQTQKTYMAPDSKMAVLINENPFLLLLLEHFQMDLMVGNKTVKQLCSENGINLPVFITFGNLYNGFFPSGDEITSSRDVPDIIRFLKSSHRYYKEDKYPEIRQFIQKLYKNNPRRDVELIDKFFQNYFEEVLEHLDYEDNIAFPYFSRLTGEKDLMKKDFSVSEYREHHTDIETKLTDLKNLLLKHLPIKNDLPFKRKILLSLFQLEFDLNIHSIIEEKILLPLGEKIEKSHSDG